MLRLSSPRKRFEFTCVIHSRFPRELRDMIYDHLLTGDFLEAIQKPMQKPTHNFIYRVLRAFGRQHPLLVLIDGGTRAEIVFRYYRTGKYPPVTALNNVDAFLRNDFFGVGITGETVALPHLEVRRIEREDFGPPSPNAFASLIAHTSIWKNSSRFTFRISVQDELYTLDRKMQTVRGYLDKLVTVVRLRGAKVEFSLVRVAHNGEILRVGLESFLDTTERERKIELANKQTAMIELWCQSIKTTSRSRRPCSQDG